MNESEESENCTPSLEHTIESMSEGRCFDTRHYHAFQGVNILLPLHTCVVCQQRLQAVASFSSSQVVQCIACRVLAHRSCAFSKDSKWEEKCSVNYAKAMEQEQQSQEPTQPAHESHEKDKGKEPHKESLSLWKLPSLPFPSIDWLKSPASTDHNDHNDDLDDPKEHDNATTPESAPILTYSSTPDFDTHEKMPVKPEGEYDASIFRTAKPTGNDPSVAPTILSTSSEGGIIDGSLLRTRVSKAHFPFLSAATLLESSRDDATPVSSCEIERSQTWSEGGPPIRVALKHNEKSNVRREMESLNVKNDTDETQTREELTETTNKSPGTTLHESSLLWTADGPPVHWATAQSLEGLSKNKLDTQGDNGETTDEDPLHFAQHPFSSVSRALQENIIAHFRPVVDRMVPKEETKMDKVQTESEEDSDSSTQEEPPPPSSTGDTQTEASSLPDRASKRDHVEGLLEENTPKEDMTTVQKRLGLATVAGGIAGGFAGLIFAGPVGGVIGAKCGQTAGILGVVLEGSVTLGVISSGIAAGRYTGQQLQEKLDEDRVLSLGGDGTSRRMLLIRPTVKTDPVWATIYTEARQSYSSSPSFNLLPNDTKAAKRERYEREVDIVKTDETEIPTADKVLLLVSRILNNKESLPGHVYRELIGQLRQRAVERQPPSELIKTTSSAQEGDPDVNDAVETEGLIRARRQDAHAVIKYVTATFLEIRPGFAASPKITELTATAVESLVFGEVYDLVFEEIETELQSQDNELLDKVAAFELHQSTIEQDGWVHKGCISQVALEALRQLPEAHSAADKFRYCVAFLEHISEQFSTATDKSSTKPMGADSLLKMVCQHIIVAKVIAINAQITFLDEFARDEQLLRGKEGYSLVTLQASLHFLNGSTDFQADIFEQDD